MSQTGTAGHGPGQIIIVRRNHDHEDAHHGGVWKIAFADFMTAMMAFFLVMWLTNASDDATKKQIAQYFNPIKLNSSTPETLGLDVGKNTAPASKPMVSQGEVANGGDRDQKPISGSALGGQEQALFRDPYAVLAEIAAEGGPGIEDGVAGKPDGSGLPGLNGGDAYRDPFDPTSWQLEPNASEKVPDKTVMTPAELDPEKAPAPPAVPVTTTTEVTPSTPPAAAVPVPSAAVAASGDKAKDAKVKDAEVKDAKAKDAEPKDADAKDAQAKEAASLKREIEKSVAATPGAASGVEVTAGEGGITISLADSLTSGMFEIGSAKPTPDAVRLVEKIAKILGERQGTIAIRGHTDSRPYAGVEYDNWRLSAARAQIAYYMLVRGGLDENRVKSIEGFADRQPKDAAHPEAAINRRIEILLSEPRS